MPHRIPSRARAMRRAPLPLLVLVLACLTGAARPAMAREGPHPLYGDGGTLRWYTDLDEAQAVATREGKLLLVDVSVANCRPCATAIGMIGEASLRARVAGMAVGYHVDARQGTAWVRDFRAHLRNAAYLPLIGFFTPGKAWISGFAPSRLTSTAELQRRFLVAMDLAASYHRATRPRPSPAEPTPVPAHQPDRGDVLARPGPGPRAVPSGPRAGLTWYERITDAEAAARAEGKIIFVTSTKPNCGLCEKLKEEVVPQIWRELSQGCVFYVYDITRPEDRSVDRLVRSNLPRARFMPLAGFMTTDRRWLLGFAESTDARKLLSDYRTALQRR